MLLLNIALLALSAVPSSLAEGRRHHRSSSIASISASTFATLATATNATQSLTTMSAPGGSWSCPTVTATVEKTRGICPIAICEPIVPIPPVTSTFVVGCGCPAATPTSTTSTCPEGDCGTTTIWSYTRAGGC